MVTMEQKPVQGVKTRVYSCSNVKVTTEDDGDTWEQTGSCQYTVWGHSLKRYGGSISPKNVRELLDSGQFIATLTNRYGQKYQKYVITNEQYGLEVLFSEEVESLEEI